MINHFRRHLLVYFGYVLPVILNVFIFRTFSGPQVAPFIVALATLCPVANWVVPGTVILLSSLDAIGRLILPWVG